MNPQSLVESITVIPSLAKFVEAGSLSDLILSNIGDVALDAARNSLKDAKIASSSKSYREQVAGAITQLGIGLSAQVKIIDSFQGASMMSHLKRIRYQVARGKAHYICCLVAICHTYLEEPVLRDKYLNLATKYLSHRPTIPPGIAGIGIGSVLFATFIPQAASVIAHVDELDSPFYNYHEFVAEQDTQKLKEYLLRI